MIPGQFVLTLASLGVVTKCPVLNEVECDKTVCCSAVDLEM